MRNPTGGRPPRHAARGGTYPLRIRPGLVGGGGGGGRAFGTCTVSGSNSAPIPPGATPINTIVYGSPSLFTKGSLPDLSKDSVAIAFSVTPISFAESQGTSSTLSYSQDTSCLFGLCLYCGSNRIIFTLPSTDWFSIGVTQTYCRVYNYSAYGPPWQGSTTCRTGDNLPGTGYIYTVSATQPWLVPPATAIIPDGIGLRASVSRGSASMTARVAFWWSV